MYSPHPTAAEMGCCSIPSCLKRSAYTVRMYGGKLHGLCNKHFERHKEKVEEIVSVNHPPIEANIGGKLTKIEEIVSVRRPRTETGISDRGA